MENASKYELIHIDTLEVTMCKKYTIGGFDYYVKSDNEIDAPQSGVLNHFYQILNNTIATTNSDLHLCPQVVDYVEELVNDYLRTGCSFNPNDTNAEKYLKTGYIDAIYDHLETHSFSDEEVMVFAEWLRKYEFNPMTKDWRHQNQSKTIKSTKDLLALFKSTLPIKVYYK